MRCKHKENSLLLGCVPHSSAPVNMTQLDERLQTMCHLVFRYLRHRPAERAVLYPLTLQRIRVPLLTDAALGVILQDAAELKHEVEARRVLQQSKDLKEGLHAGAAEMSMAQWATPRLASRESLSLSLSLQKIICSKFFHSCVGPQLDWDLQSVVLFTA